MPRFPWAAPLALLLVAAPLVADEPAPAPTPAPGLLLPVYAVDAPLDAAGAVDAKAWAELKSAGFNAVRFPVELDGGKAATGRLASLCAWAQAEKVGLIPVLVAGDAQPLGKALEGAVKDFAAGLAEAVAATNPTAYTRILTFQVGPELNHPGRNGRQETKQALGVALAAAKALREAERKALEPHGLSPTPLSVSASFDVPLLAAGAAPGSDLGEGPYEAAYASLRQDVASIAASPDLDIVTVSWFAGSLSGGGAARFSAFLRSLAADAPGKQLMLVTGISAAFRPPAEADTFAKLAFANLAEHRTSGGADSPFIGVVFHRGLQGAAAAPAPGGFEESRTAWTAEDLARGVLAHWRGDKAPEAIAYWTSEVEARFGLLGAEGPTPGLAGLRQVAGIVTDPATQKAVAEAVATPAPTPSAPPSDAPGVTPTPAPTPVGESGPTTTEPEEDPDKPPSVVKEKLEAAALAALDQLLSRLTGAINEKLDGGPDEPEPVAVSIVSAACQPASPKVNQLVTCQVNLRNDSTKTDAVGLSVALLDAGDYLLGDETMIDGVSVARSAQAMVPLKWHPSATGTQAVRVKVYDASYAEVGSGSAGQVTVKSGGSSKPGKGGKIAVKPGFPWTGALLPKGSAMKTMSAQGGSFTFPIANTYARTLPPMTAALFVSGQRVRSLPVPALLPGQSRQVVFDGVKVGSAGDHDLRVTLERPGTPPFTAGTFRLDRKMLTAPPQAPVKTTTTTRPVLGGPRVMPRPTPRATPRPTPEIRRTLPTPPTPMPLPTPAGHPDLGFLGGVRVSPSVARAGQTVSVGATLANRGTRVSGSVAVVFEVRDASGRVVARGSRRLAPVAGRGQSQVSWSGALPAGGPWRVDVRIDTPGDANPGDNTASASIRAQATPPRVPPRRR